MGFQGLLCGPEPPPFAQEQLFGTGGLGSRSRWQDRPVVQGRVRPLNGRDGVGTASPVGETWTATAANRPFERSPTEKPSRGQFASVHHPAPPGTRTPLGSAGAGASYQSKFGDNLAPSGTGI